MKTFTIRNGDYIKLERRRHLTSLVLALICPVVICFIAFQGINAAASTTQTTHTVSLFVLNDIIPCQVLELNHGELFDFIPQTSISPQLVFAGWTTNPDSTTPNFELGTPITHDLSLYIIWAWI
ncbi:MAG: hypothetical protein FWE16_03145 [Firmicutes bacterium]|nr:hypothetical protein [Bacillota bacterium]